MIKSGICIGKYMSVTQRMLKAYLRIKLRDYEIGHQHFIFLLYLFGHDSMSQKQINDSMQYDKGVVTRIAEYLEQYGYIQRENNPVDHRAYKLHLTQKAKDFYPEMMDILSEWNDSLLSEESDETIKVLTPALNRIAQKSIDKVKEVKNAK